MNQRQLGSRHKKQFIFFIFLSYFFSVFSLQDFKIQDVNIKFSGQCSVEHDWASNLNSLNNDTVNDSLSYLQTTLDYNTAIFRDAIEKSWVHFYNTVRFRFIWGAAADTVIAQRYLKFITQKEAVSSSATNKHLLWLREAWFKVCVNEASKDNYLKFGLIPFEIGRGISLGAAYEVAGFLGFDAEMYIDQYPPSILCHCNAIPEKYETTFYIGLLRNPRPDIETQLSQLQDQAHKHVLGVGIGRKAFVCAWDHKIKNIFGKKTTECEPYIIYLSADDRTIEFPRDVDAKFATLGMAIESQYDKCAWGFEGAFNLGCLYMKAFDRNAINYIRNTDGALIAQYTKIYDQDPKNIDAKLVQDTSATEVYVYGTPQNYTMNGKQIGPNLYNSYDRFMPVQTRDVNGFFVLADAEYYIIPKQITLYLGAGYGSGSKYFLDDLNQKSNDFLCNQVFSNFIPIQSIYTGKRIHHVVVFNQGLPWCNGIPQITKPLVNLSPNLQLSSINTVSDLIFAGGRLKWQPTSLRPYQLEFSGNIVAYWTPEPSADLILANKLASGKLTHCDKRILGGDVRNYLGAEYDFEFSWVWLEKLKCAGYVGVFVPGGFYYDAAGTVLNTQGIISGTDIGYVGNFVVTYEF